MRGYFLFFLFLAVSNFAVAQNWAGNMRFWRWYDGQYYGANYGYGGSTVLGSQLRGYAEYIAARGYYAEARSRAMIHYQEAYNLYLQNQKQRVKDYYEIREIHDDYIKRHTKPPLSKEKRAELARQGLPKRLLPTQWDVETQSLKWPGVLRREEFTELTARLNELFGERFDNPENTGAGSENHAAVIEAVEQADALLVQALRSERMSSAIFTPAKNFLRTLKYEASFVPGTNQKS